ncbi:MAG: hypothetical protein D6E12_00855 [Desulfovibrio sp.]|nr:MAG: hypothetical protein D6E12_00855 [Desulfovibrio sp.]
MPEGKGRTSVRPGSLRARMSGMTAKHCAVVSGLSLAASLPVWILAFKAASWSGDDRNLDAFRTSFLGLGTLIGQLLVALMLLAVLILMHKGWSRFQRVSCALLLPAPILSTLLAMAYGFAIVG